jgi:hypothetical protein
VAACGSVLLLCCQKHLAPSPCAAAAVKAPHRLKQAAAAGATAAAGALPEPAAAAAAQAPWSSLVQVLMQPRQQQLQPPGLKAAGVLGLHLKEWCRWQRVHSGVPPAVRSDAAAPQILYEVVGRLRLAWQHLLHLLLHLLLNLLLHLLMSGWSARYLQHCVLSLPVSLPASPARTCGQADRCCCCCCSVLTACVLKAALCWQQC